MQKRITLNGVIGLLISVAGLAGFYATYGMPLRSNELIQPRVAIGLLIVGGLWVFLTEMRTPSREYVKLEKDRLLLLSVFGVSAATYIYGQIMLRLGVFSSAFLFLVVWWLYITIRDTVRSGQPMSRFLVSFSKHVLLAAAISGGFYALFITFLQMYLPGILLF